jgi:putative endonuclease
MSQEARQRLGQLGEAIAAEHLTRRGFRVLDRNYRTRWGELDIVANDGRTLAFVEVKSRRASLRLGTPFEAVDLGKRAQVRKMGRAWLAAHPDRPWASAIRFDAIGLVFDRSGRLLALEHLEGAF